jgi:hypothetical protein
MFGIEVLDVLIGLITIYLAFAVACTAIVEMLTALLKLRSKNLELAMSEFLAGKFDDGESFVTAFYKHPLVQSLSQGDDGRPSYVPPALVGQVVESSVLAKTGEKDLKEALAKLPNSRAKGLLLATLEQTERATANFKEAVEKQFDATMDRASGWFRRRTQRNALLVSAALVVFLNIDTASIVSELSVSPEARASLVELAEKHLASAENAEEAVTIEDAGDGKKLERAKEASAAAEAALASATGTLNAAKLPLGWSEATLPRSGLDWVTKISGLLVSIFAISLGSPFWFSVLEKFKAVRTSGTQEKTKTEKEKDQKP